MRGREGRDGGEGLRRTRSRSNQGKLPPRLALAAHLIEEGRWAINREHRELQTHGPQGKHSQASPVQIGLSPSAAPVRSFPSFYLQVCPLVYHSATAGTQVQYTGTWVIYVLLLYLVHADNHAKQPRGRQGGTHGEDAAALSLPALAQWNGTQNRKPLHFRIPPADHIVR